MEKYTFWCQRHKKPPQRFIFQSCSCWQSNSGILYLPNKIFLQRQKVYKNFQGTMSDKCSFLLQLVIPVFITVIVFRQRIPRFITSVSPSVASIAQKMIKILFHHRGTQKQVKRKPQGCAFNSALSKVRQSKGAGQALVDTTPGTVIGFYETQNNNIDHFNNAVSSNDVNLSPLE